MEYTLGAYVWNFYMEFLYGNRLVTSSAEGGGEIVVIWRINMEFPKFGQIEQKIQLYGIWIWKFTIFFPKLQKSNKNYKK